jgi:F420H(2)-dependent quinone reductase
MASARRVAMRAFGALSIRMYRASGGRLMGSMGGTRVLLLTVAGRKTGVKHTTVVAFIEDGGRFVVAGSAGGSPSEPQWFRNLRSADRAEIEVGPRRLGAAVAVAAPDEREVLWRQLVGQAPSFAAYQAKLDRVIPLAILTPTP